MPYPSPADPSTELAPPHRGLERQYVLPRVRPPAAPIDRLAQALIVAGLVWFWIWSLGALAEALAR